MKVVESFVKPMSFNTVEDLKRIESAGRVCYRSGDSITEDSYVDFIRKIISRGHESVLEHASVTLMFFTDRGVTHELVRHRLASYSQESTRYVNYGKDDMMFIKPTGLNDKSFTMWSEAVTSAENAYKTMLANGSSPQQARSVLPCSVATVIVVTANLREWRTIFKLRLDKAAHPDMRRDMNKAFEIMYKMYPCVFEDLKHMQECEND